MYPATSCPRVAGIVHPYLVRATQRIDGVAASIYGSRRSHVNGEGHSY